MTQHNRGNALSMLGQRQNDARRVEEAVDAYRQALTVWKREGVPLQWAVTRNNLGDAL